VTAAFLDFELFVILFFFVTFIVPTLSKAHGFFCFNRLIASKKKCIVSPICHLDHLKGRNWSLGLGDSIIGESMK